jgi:DNA gyrase subunit A
VDDENDEVVVMICVNPETDASKTVLVVSDKGFGKRTPVDEYRFTNRGGKGVKTINVTEKTGGLVGILDVSQTEDLMITCKSGVTIRMKVANVSEQGRATQGVKLIRLDEGDEIAAITKLDEEQAETAPVEGAVDATVEGTAVTTEPIGPTGEALPPAAEGNSGDATDTSADPSVEDNKGE